MKELFDNDGSFLQQMMAVQAGQGKEEEDERRVEEEAAMAALGLPVGLGKAKVEEVLPEALYTFTVDAAQAGSKLSKLAGTLLGCSRNVAAGMAKEGDLRLNAEKSGANQVLEADDVITVYAPLPAAEEPPSHKRTREGGSEAQPNSYEMRTSATPPQRDEAERRRIKNQKKREAKAKKAAGQATQETAGQVTRDGLTAAPPDGREQDQVNVGGNEAARPA